MSPYLKLRWWVDRNWVEGIGYKSNIAVGILPFGLIPLVGKWWLWPALALFLLWSTFVGWRAWRVARANDANYDRKTKFVLSKDYRNSESAMKASFKRRRRN